MSVSAAQSRRIAALRAEIGAITASGREAGAVLPFGADAIDARLVGGGLAAAALHEASGGAALADDAAATLFLAGIAARRAREMGEGAVVLWAFGRAELYGPGLQQAGLAPERLLLAEAGDDAAVLAVMEEGLRHGGLAAVVGEVRLAGMTATRRLQLAAEERGVTALLLRRPRARDRDALAEPSAATTRWRVGAMPSARLADPVGDAGIGRARWQLDLLRQRGGEPCSWIVEGTDAEGRLALPAGFRDGPAAPARPADSVSPIVAGAVRAAA
ncbi:ImuA family protein [Sphingomonas quercus]|uniref:ImuA family protein n=1 Tax=Sphingomonas quercus TaxID=2842451 RepID=UPI00209ADD57|nr:protein ImuA [Sphingomonas quercus]